MKKSELFYNNFGIRKIRFWVSFLLNLVRVFIVIVMFARSDVNVLIHARKFKLVFHWMNESIYLKSLEKNDHCEGENNLIRRHNIMFTVICHYNFITICNSNCIRLNHSKIKPIPYSYGLFYTEIRPIVSWQKLVRWSLWFRVKYSCFRRKIIMFANGFKIIFCMYAILLLIIIIINL